MAGVEFEETDRFGNRHIGGQRLGIAGHQICPPSQSERIDTIFLADVPAAP